MVWLCGESSHVDYDWYGPQIRLRNRPKRFVEGWFLHIKKKPESVDRATLFSWIGGKGVMTDSIYSYMVLTRRWGYIRYGGKPVVKMFLDLVHKIAHEATNLKAKLQKSFTELSDDPISSRKVLNRKVELEL